MNKKLFYILLIFIINGCQEIKKSLGMQKDGPDEFLIKKYDPIQRPPTYDLLPPNSKTKKIEINKKDNVRSIIENNLKKNIKNTDEANVNKSENSLLEDEILKEIKN